MERKKIHSLPTLAERTEKLAKKVAASAAAVIMLSNYGLNGVYAANSNISIDGRTATQVDTNGNIINIHTNTFSNNQQNAFNSFSYFNVAQGDTVNLHFSNTANTMTATNLINYVTGGSLSTIDGMLNGVKNGQIGGNVYLLNPSGIMVGNTGIINVGNLTLSARSNPLETGLNVNNSLANIVSGISSGEITVKGKVNTVTGATLYGTNISNSGVIQTGASYTATAPDFSNVVNTNNLQTGTNIYEENGSIYIGGNSFTNTGTLMAHVKNTEASTAAVTISANNVTLSGKLLTGGANLDVEAKDSITVNNGAVISTRQIDRTAAVTDEVSSLSTGSSGGLSLVVNHQTYKDKASIDIGGGAQLVSFGNNGKAGGDITAIASSQDQLFAWAMTGPEAKVTVSNALLKGNNITIQAVAQNDAESNPTFSELDDTSSTASLEELKNSSSGLVSMLGNLRAGAVVSNVYAKANVTIDDKAKLQADQNVKVDSVASSKVSSILMSVIGGVGVALSEADAVTAVNKGAQITAGGDVTLSSATKNTINMTTRPIPVAGGKMPLNVMVTYSGMSSDSSTTVGAGAAINAGGAVNVQADSIKDMNTAASASTGAGFLGMGVAISQADVKADATVSGQVTAGSVAVKAKVETLQNNTRAESSVGDGDPGSGLDLAIDWIANGLVPKVKDLIGVKPGEPSSPPSVGITGAIAVTLSENTATAKITSTGTTDVNGTAVTNAVQSQGNVSVTADVTDVMKTAAIAQQKQREKDNVLGQQTEANKKVAGVSAAVIYGQYTNNANAFIGDNAVVDAKKKLDIQSSVTIPFDNHWGMTDQSKVVENITNAFMSENLGLDKAMFTSWAQASADADKGSGAASVDIMNFNNNTKAYIGKNALVNQDTAFNSANTENDVSVKANTKVTTLDLSGMLKSPLDNMIKSAREGKIPTTDTVSAFGNTTGGSGVGGSVLVTLENNNTQAYIDAGSKINAHDVTVNANSEVKNIAIGAAGGKAASVGFNGTAVANLIDNKTYAQVIDAADIKASNNVDIKAADDIYNITAAGGVTESNSVGIGVSVAYNSLKRDTLASASGMVTAGNNLGVNADNTGAVITVSLAGSVTADAPPPPPASPPTEDKSDPVEYIRFLFADDQETVDAIEKPLDKVNEKVPALSTKDGSGQQSKSGISVAGNVSINVTDEKARAVVGDTGSTPAGTTLTAKNISITAENDTGIYAISGAVAVAANADPSSKGIGGAFMLNKVKETTEASVVNATLVSTGAAVADGLAVKATNDSYILSIAASGGVAPSGTGVAGQVSLNMTDNATSAHVGNSTLTAANDIGVTADDQATITAVGGAVAYGGTAGIGASVAVNVMDNTTEAYSKNSQMNGTGQESDIRIQAKEDSTITAVTAAIGASRGQMAGAISATGNALTNTTRAYIDGMKGSGIAATTGGSIGVAAMDEAEVTSIAGAGALAANGTGVGVGASAAVLVTDNQVKAYIGEQTKVQAQGNSTGFTADGQEFDGLSVTAKSNERVTTLAAGGAGGGAAGIAGSAVVNVLKQTSDARIGAQAGVNEGASGESDEQSVNVAAANTTQVTGLAGAIGVGKQAGVGAASDIEVITAVTEAAIESGAKVGAKKNITVEATAKETLTALAIGAAGGQSAGIAGSVNVHTLTSTTKAHIGNENDTLVNRAIAESGDSIAVVAKDNSTINLIAGAAAYGGSVGIGASVDANIITKTTAAYIGDYAKVQAGGSGNGIAVENGTYDVAYQDYSADSFVPASLSTNGNGSINNDAVIKDRKATAKTSVVKGVAVSADSQTTVRTVALGAGASGSVAATGSATVNVVTNHTDAYVGNNADMNTSSLAVNAGSDYFHLGISGAGSVGTGGAGVGAGADVSILNNITKAFVDQSAQVTAGKDIAIQANSGQEVISVAAALGASGEVGIAGAVGANIINSETKAYTNSNSTLTAQNNLQIRAADNTDIISVAGGAGIGLGTAGVGGSVSTTVIDKDTSAYVGSGSTVEARANLADDQLTVYTGQYDSSGKQKQAASGLAVQAESSETVTDVVASGGGGLYAGVAGAVAVNIDESGTKAYIDENARINQGTGANDKQSVNVAAVNDVRLLSVSGAAGGGMVGVSGGVDVGIVQNDTAAYIGNGAAVKAQKDVLLAAMSDKTIASNAVSISGGAVGVAGSVSVYALGTNLSTDAQSGLTVKKDSSNANNPREDNVQSYVDGQLQTDKYSGLLNSYSNDDVKASAVTLQQNLKKVNVSQTVENTMAVPGGTAAFAGEDATVNSGGKLTMAASDKLDFDSRVGAAAIGGGAVGGAVSVVTVSNNADSHAGSGTSLNAGGGIALTSTLSTDVNAKSIAGVAGMSGAIAGSGVVVADNSTAKAYMDNVAKVAAANLKISANSSHTISGTAFGGAAALMGPALSGAVVDGTVSGTTAAYLGNAQANSSNNIAISGNMDIIADTATSMDGLVIAPVVGQFAGGAGVTILKDHSAATAFIGKEMTVQQADAINVIAKATPHITAETDVISGGIGALGASIAVAEATGSSTAYIGEGAQIGQVPGQTVTSVTVQAQQLTESGQDTAKATARGGAIGGLAAQGIVTQATVSPTVTASTGDSVRIKTMDKVTVNASAQPQARAISAGINAGALAVGVSTARAEIEPVITAAIGRTNQITAGGIEVKAEMLRASSAISGQAAAFAAGGGLVGINATVSEVEGGAEVYGSVGDGTQLTVESGNVEISAGADMKQVSDATAIAVGIVAVGANHASASSNNNVKASLGNKVVVNAIPGSVNIKATAVDNNTASAVAGTGGIVAGSAATAATHTGGSTRADLGIEAQVKAGSLGMTANHTTIFNAVVNSVNASLLGASGAVATHTVDTDVSVVTGAKSQVTTTGDTVLHASNTSVKDWLGGAADGDAAGWNISAAGGGAINGAAVVNRITVTHDTDIVIGEESNITTGTVSKEGSFAADAESSITVHDKARINTGGAIAAAIIDSRIEAKGKTVVEFGEGAVVNSKQGTVKAGAKGNADIDNRVAVDVYGLAGAPAGKAYSNYTGSNLLTVSPSAQLSTNTGDIILAAGQDTAGNVGTVNANAVVNLWNKTVVPINTTPDPQANITNNSTVDIKSGSAVSSARDLYLTADKGNMNATYTGVGKDLYREAAAAVGSAISNLFGGGDVNLDIKGGSRSVSGSANVNVDGTAQTGVKRHQELTINGHYEQVGDSYVWVSTFTGSDGVTYSIVNKEIGQGMTERLEKLYALKAQYTGDAIACAAYDAEILFLQEKMVAMGLATWDGGKFVPLTSSGAGNVSPKQAAETAQAYLTTEKAAVDGKVTTQQGVVTTATTVASLAASRDTAQTSLEQKRAQVTEGQNCTLAAAQAKVADSATSADDKVKYQAVIDAYGVYDGYITQLGTYTTDINITQTAADQVKADEAAKLAELITQQTQIGNSLTAVTTALDDTVTPLSDEIPKGPTADFITVDDITALRGNIKVKADNLTGSGKLNAPGDASITITNNSPDFLNVSNLSVGSGGSILLNGAVVGSVAEINAFNTNKAGANFAEVITKKDTDSPVISIKSNFNPDDAQNKVTIKGTTVKAAISSAPDITLDGNIANMEGKVEVKSVVGSIYANGSISAGTVDIKANNGDFVQRYVEGFNHIGGDPSGIYNKTSQPGGIVANGNIFISARYLNINGLIQSGIDKWSLTLSDAPTLTATGAQLGLSGTASVTNGYGTATYNAATQQFEFDLAYAKNYATSAEGKVKNPSGIYALVLSGTDNISAGYDAVHDQYVINGAEVHGGYVQLYGQIMNTAKDGAATGKVKALDGYGTISISNNSGKDIVISKLDTGSGLAGIIDITDIQDSDGKAIHTRYTSNQGVLTTETTGRWNGSTFEAGYSNTATTNPTSAGGRVATTYNPQADLYYTWTTGTDKSQTEFYHYESNDVFGFQYSDHTVGWLTGIRYGETKALDDGTYLTKGSRPYAGQSGYQIDSDSYYSGITQTIANGTPAYAKIREWTKRKWWTFGIAGTYYLDYQLTRPLKDITTNTVKASNPIGIEFFGSNSGSVNITGNNANVLLNGAINNKDGSTVITAGKDILQAGEDALITTKSLDMTAQNIGSAADAVRVIVNDPLKANALNGNINVTQILGDLKLGSVTADSGTLTLTADGSIVNGAGTSNVRGQRIELTSVNGAIGATGAPLVIQTGATSSTADADKVKYGLKASALGDIAIENQAWAGGGNENGNLLIDTVVSTAGNVTLATPGQMIDNNVNEQIDKRTWDQLTSFWDSLQLRSATAANEEKQAQTIAGYTSGKTADYQSYWQLKAYIVDGKYVCPGAQRAILQSQGYSDAQLTAFETGQTTRFQQLAAQGVGAWNNGEYTASFVYAATDAEKAQLLKGSSWTDRELAISLSPGALKELTDTNPVIKDPNVKGVNVTLQAGGGIGSNVSLAGIDANTLPQNLTPEQKVALAAAERDDLAVVGNIIQITQRKPVNVEAVGGMLNASTAADAYLASEKTVIFDQITAGGDIRLKVGGSIMRGRDTSRLSGQDVILEAANGGIGQVDAQLILTNNGTITARAADDIFLQRDGDIKVDSIYSLKDVSLDATGNIEAAYDDELNIMSRSLKLKSQKAIGNDSKTLGVALSSDGQLTAEAQGNISVRGAKGALGVDQVKSATGDVDLSAKESIVNRGVDSGTVNVSGKNLRLAAQTGNIGEAGRQIIVSGEDRFTAEAQTDINVISTKALAADTMISRAGGIHVSVANGESLRIDKAEVSTDMSVRADNVTLNQVLHTGTSPLSMDISGSTKAMADQVIVNVSSAQGVEFHNLMADHATIQAKTDRLSFKNSITGSRADMTNNYYTVIADNQPQNLFESEVIIQPRDNAYYLLIDGKNVVTDTIVLNSKGGIMVNGSANPDNAANVTARSLNNYKGPDMSEISGIASFVRGSSRGLSGNESLENTVDFSQLSLPVQEELPGTEGQEDNTQS